MSTFVTFPIIVSLELISSVMIAETISLGILALPKALSILGLLPYTHYRSSTYILSLLANEIQGYLYYPLHWNHLLIHGLHNRTTQDGTSRDTHHGRRWIPLNGQNRPSNPRNRPINLLHFRHGKSHPNILNNDERPKRSLNLYNNILLHRPPSFIYVNSTPTPGTTILPFSREFHQYHRCSTYKYDRSLSK